MENIKSVIEEQKASLKWTTEYGFIENCHAAALLMDQYSKSFLFHIPDHADDMAHLHEIGHAYLAEHINPLFGGFCWDDGTTEKDIDELFYFMVFSLDWFVEYWQKTLVPNSYRKMMDDSLDELKDKESRKKYSDNHLYLSFAFATLHDYYPSTKPGNLAGKIVDIFLNIDPSKPSLSSLERLLNKLFEAFNIKKRLKAIEKNNMWFWQVINDITKFQDPI